MADHEHRYGVYKIGNFIYSACSQCGNIKNSEDAIDLNVAKELASGPPPGI